MKYIDLVFNVLLDLFVFLAKCMIILMTAIVCVSVYYRYVLNTGIRWSEEVSMLLMVYIGFISVAYGVKNKLHLSVELFYNMFPKTLQTIFSKITLSLVSALGCVMAVYGVLLMKSTMRNVMVSTRWPAATLYAMVPVSGLLIAYFAFSQVIGYQSQYKVKKTKEGDAE